MSKAPERSRGATTSRGPAAPFSRPFTVEELLRRPEEPLTVKADKEELEALARTDDLPAVSKLEGEFKVNRHGKTIRVTGEVRALVTQQCVVTLEPFESEVIEPVDVRFASAPAPATAPRPAERASRRRAAQLEPDHRAAPVFPNHEEDDPPDPIVEGKIDLGALAAEFMSLGLDPYPRKPGASFQAIVEDKEPEESPFARLAEPRQKG
jgi:hypothetical protein